MQEVAYPTYTTPQPHQVPVSQDEMYASLIQEERVKNIIAQISPEQQLFEIEMRLKGYRKNYLKGGGWEKIDSSFPDPHPLLIARYMSYLGSIVNQNTSLSNLSAGQINNIMARLIEWVTDDLDANAFEYGMGSNYTERTRIGHIMCVCTFMVLNRALDGGEARRLWKALNVSESMNDKAPQKGLMDSLAFWRNR